MPRSRPGPLISTPFISALPPEGSSSPAKIRSSVDFPHPEGPTMQTNSFSFTERLTSKRAATSLPRSDAKCLPKPSILRRLLSFIIPSPVQTLPLKRAALHQHEDRVDQDPHDADGDHPRDDDVRLRHRVGVRDEVPDPGDAAGHHLGGDQAHPGDSQPHPQPREDLRGGVGYSSK